MWRLESCVVKSFSQGQIRSPFAGGTPLQDLGRKYINKTNNNKEKDLQRNENTLEKFKFQKVLKEKSTPL